MSESGTLKSNPLRMTLVALCFTFGLSVIVSQLVRDQVFRHKELTEKAKAQLVAEREAPTVRGPISDVHGRILALDIVDWEIAANPPLVTRPEELSAQLAQPLGLPADRLYALLTSDMPWVLLARQVPYQTGEALFDLHASGLDCNPRPLRAYPEGDLTSHVIGFVNDTDEGFYGVEGYYNKSLKPVAAKRQVQQDPAGRELPISALGTGQSAAGAGLVLTLDLNIQYLIDQELRLGMEKYGVIKGTAIVMDPRTGAILASVSLPNYDPNAFANSDVSLMSDPVVSNMWEPGSIFKVITWAGALDAGVITPDTSYDDVGSIEVGGRTIRNWDRSGHGVVTVEEGLVKSLNTVAAFISTSLGKDRFYTYLRRFGFGSLTEVDLAGEGPGMMKLPGDTTWFPSDLGTNSFGQGIAVTPIQMITAIAAVANDGLLMKPHIVSRYIVHGDQHGEDRVIQVEPTVVRRAVSPQTAETLTEMLVQVVEQGTEKASVPGYRIAGKSGTAQVPTAYGYHPTETIASFIGYAPADDPEFIVLVKLDKPEASPWGTQTAAPIFQLIAQKLFLYLQIPPDDARLASRSDNGD